MGDDRSVEGQVQYRVCLSVPQNKMAANVTRLLHCLLDRGKLFCLLSRVMFCDWSDSENTSSLGCLCTTTSEEAFIIFRPVIYILHVD